jgi:PucR family transcriptional regulator, purine catabolism regulatory protein
VDRLLGPVLVYDAIHKTELLRSLAVFLEENRSWQRAAGRLHVHKQTLVYRMSRAEALTGRRLNRTADVAELWLALRARELVESVGAAGAGVSAPAAAQGGSPPGRPSS